MICIINFIINPKIKSGIKTKINRHTHVKIGAKNKDELYTLVEKALKYLKPQTAQKCIYNFKHAHLDKSERLLYKFKFDQHLVSITIKNNYHEKIIQTMLRGGGPNIVVGDKTSAVLFVKKTCGLPVTSDEAVVLIKDAYKKYIDRTNLFTY